MISCIASTSAPASVRRSGREAPWPPEGEYRSSPSDAPFSGVRFRIDAVYQKTVCELEQRSSLLWLVFAPLCVDADAEKLKHVVEKLRAALTRDKFKELAVAMLVMADLDRRQRGLRSALVPLLDKEITMQNWIYQQGREKGIEEGIETGIAALAHLFERRLGRGLCEEERRSLADRLLRLGPDRVGDAIIDLDADALANWLADPEAH